MKPKVIGTDNSLEFGKACEDLSWNHCTSTPHRSETHGIAERAVRRLKEGTSAMPLQSGVDNEWWVDSMEFYSYLRHIQDLWFDGKTPYERRFGMPFNEPVILFGALVENHLISANDQSRLHQFGAKVLSGFFPGYALYVRRIYGRGHKRIGEDGRIGTPRQKDQCEGSVNAAQKWKLDVPSQQMEESKSLGENSV